MTSMTGGGGMAPKNVKSFDKPPKGYGTLQNFTPDQMNLFQQMFGSVGPESYLSKLAGGDEDIFRQIEEPGYRNFQEQLGGIASRFSSPGAGALSGRRSSGFQNATTSAASNFAQDLASRRQALQRQAMLDLHGMSRDLLNQEPYSFYQKPPKQNKGLFGGFGGVGGAVLGGVGGLFAGAPAQGAALGYQAGNALESGLSGFGQGGGGGGGYGNLSGIDEGYGDFVSKYLSGGSLLAS